MAHVTVNYLLAMEKSLRERLNQLNELKQASARETFWDKADGGKRETPTYDIKKVDRKIVAINQALFEMNHRIKESNAKTTVDVAVNYNELVSEIE